MIWSVSTLDRRSGSARPMCVVNWSMSADPFSVEVSRCGKVSGHGGRRRDQRRDEMRPPSLALAAFEVAIGCRRAPLTRRQLVGVHAEAHRTAGPSPLGTGLLEHNVETLVLCQQPDSR